MYFTSAIAAAILAATASAKGHNNAATTTDAVITSSAAPNATWITQTVTEFITDCPTPTSFVHNKETYTVTESTKVTLPCPHTCTISWNPTKPSVTPVGVVPSRTWNSTASWTNGTVPGVVPVPTATGSNSGSSGSDSGSGSTNNPLTVENAGSFKAVGTAAVLAGVVGVAALAL